MKITRQEASKAAVLRSQAVILFGIGPHTFAIPATDVDEIRDLHGLTSVATSTMRTAVAKVKSTLFRERKKYFVVDANQHFCLLPSKSSRVLILRESRSAVTVDSIDRIIEVPAVLPLPHAFHGDEQRWYRGVALLEDTVVPVVNSAAFLSPTEATLAQSLLRHAKGAAV